MGDRHHPTGAMTLSPTNGPIIVGALDPVGGISVPVVG